MKVVQINASCGGSTGRISLELSRALTARNVENVLFYSEGDCRDPLAVRHMGTAERKCQALGARAFGDYGFWAAGTTRRLIRELERIDPDIVHLHNLHGNNVDMEGLMDFFREKKTRLIWTFHDCWAFTGYCPHYEMAGCSRWKQGCGDCPQKRRFSWCADRSAELLRRKQALLSGLDLTIAAPSGWMADQVRQSFLKEHPVRVIHNGIDLTVFRPEGEKTAGAHDLVLGVANVWDARKGLDVFCQLAEILDERFQILLVGGDRRIQRKLPKRIRMVDRTGDPGELARWYREAAVFVNPTREETLGLTNLEALACGTPVVTFDSGGSPECCGPDCGIVVKKGDVQAMAEAITWVCESRPFSREACVRQARRFDKRKMVAEYLSLYGIGEESPWES